MGEEGGIVDTAFTFVVFMAAKTVSVASMLRSAVFATNHSVSVPGSAAKGCLRGTERFKRTGSPQAAASARLLAIALVLHSTFCFSNDKGTTQAESKRVLSSFWIPSSMLHRYSCHVAILPRMTFHAGGSERRPGTGYVG